MTLYRISPPQGISALRPWRERHPLLSKDLPTKRNMVGMDRTNDDNKSKFSPDTTPQGLHADSKLRLASSRPRFRIVPRAMAARLLCFAAEPVM